MRQLQPNMPAIVMFIPLLGHLEPQPVLAILSASAQLVGTTQVPVMHVCIAVISAAVGMIFATHERSCEGVLEPVELLPPDTDGTPEEMLGTLLVPLMRQLQPNMPAMV
jgi:hypothetical protein